MAEISHEYEEFVEDLVVSGQFVTRQAALDQAVALLREQVLQNDDDALNGLTAQEWCDRLEQWADGHKALPCEADDSRQSIYAGRGE